MTTLGKGSISKLVTTLLGSQFRGGGVSLGERRRPEKQFFGCFEPMHTDGLAAVTNDCP